MQTNVIARSICGLSILIGFGGCTAPAPDQPSTMAVTSSKGQAVSVEALPRPVIDAVQKELRGAMLKTAKQDGDGNYVLSDVKVGKEEYKLTVSPDGKILKKEDDDD